MPHVAFVPLTGLRVCAPELRDLGFSLPGLRKRGDAVARLPALGLLTLAGMLPEDWSCSYHPADGDCNDLVEQVLSERPTLVAISALTASIEDAYRSSRAIRAAGVPVVIGGLHVSMCPDEAEQHCDAVVIGDGEATWPAVIADATVGNLKRRYQAPKHFESAWPTPRFDLVGDTPSRFTLQTQRGCTLGCDFCAASRLLGPFREKPVDRIQRELAAILELTPRPVIELADDNTFAGARDPFVLCEALADSNAHWFTESDWRIGERPELLRSMADAGCVQVLVGVESLVFRYPGMGAKHDELSRVMDALAAIQDAGIAVNGCFIVGADGETTQSIEQLVAFILESGLAEVQIALQTPFPGTALRNRLEREGRILADRGWPHYTLLDVTFQPDRMTVDELEKMFLVAVGEVYSKVACERRSSIRREAWRRHPRFRSATQGRALEYRE